MKRLLFLIAFIGLFAQQQVMATGKIDNPNPSFNGTEQLIMPNAPINKPKSQNAAYFNTKDAVVRTFPTTLQTRSSGISLSTTDFQNLIQPNMRLESRKSTSGTVTMDIGIADNMNAQTWTLPAGFLSLFDVQGNTDFIDPTTVTPPSARVVGATHVGKKTFLDRHNESTTRYSHFKLLSNELDEMGTTFVHNGTVSNYGEAADKFADVPLDLNDVFTNSVIFYGDEEPLPKTVENATITVDGFGTITNPFGGLPATYNCLRMSISETYEMFTDNSGTPTTSETRHYVSFVTVEGFRFSARKPAAGSSGSVTLSNLRVSRFMPTPILAVELIDFQGFAQKESVDLTWTTASEKDNDYFEIERSTDGKTFETIGQVKGNGTTNSKHNYAFTDKTPLSITTYFRLKQTDFDRTSTTSNIIAIAPKSPKGTLTVYPNPSNSTLISVEISGNTEGVSVINSIGQTVFQQKTKDLFILTIDVSAFTAGVYFIKTDGNTEGVKFIKQL